MGDLLTYQNRIPKANSTVAKAGLSLPEVIQGTIHLIF